MRRHNRACGEEKANEGAGEHGGRVEGSRRDRHFVKSLLLVSPPRLAVTAR